MHKSLFWIGGAACLVGSLLSMQVRAEDYPQWRGTDRTGVSKETGLLKSWAEAPKLLWKAENLGEGHATPAVVNGRIYGMGLRGETEGVWCLNGQTGKEVWFSPIDKKKELGAGQGGYGSRSTPTIVGDKLYTLGVNGALVCLNLKDGSMVWGKSLVRDFGGEVPRWGYCESPLIDGNKLIIAPGSRDATLVALNRNTGSTLWKCAVPEGDAAHYSSAIIANVDGQKQYIHFLSGGVVGVSPEGQYLWRFNSPANNVANCSTPLYKDGYVFAASSYNTGGGLAKLTYSGGKTTAQQVYFTKDMKNHHGGMVLLGDYLYGFDDRTLTCLEFKTGKIMWTDRSVGKGSVTYADGHLYARSERGPVALVEATPTGYKEKGRFDQPDRSGAPSWPYPVVSNGRLYLRDQNVLLCYDVKAK